MEFNSVRLHSYQKSQLFIRGNPFSFVSILEDSCMFVMTVHLPEKSILEKVAMET